VEQPVVELQLMLQVVVNCLIRFRLNFHSFQPGLKVALVEKYDFGSGTSSRSTKLIHGGVRYLQKAIMQFDLEQVGNPKA
jgi:hypothetical protein